MSKALAEWRDGRRERLDRLGVAHGVVRAARVPLNTEYLNWSLLLTLTSEFHGFTRDLHDLAVETFVRSAASGNARLAAVLSARLTEGRQIAKGNPHPDALTSDFGRLGLPLWDSLGTDAAAWRLALATMMTARNAVAHADMPQLHAVRAQGTTLSVKTIKRWRQDLDGLAGAMDEAVAKHHAALFSVTPPW